jgi:hypothetical protein
VVAVRTAPVSLFVAVTVAEATGAPDESMTLPAMVAATCPRAGCHQPIVMSSANSAHRAQPNRTKQYFIAGRLQKVIESPRKQRPVDPVNINSIRFASLCQTDLQQLRGG